jgi:hypothetical protein
VLPQTPACAGRPTVADGMLVDDAPDGVKSTGRPQAAR